MTRNQLRIHLKHLDDLRRRKTHLDEMHQIEYPHNILLTHTFERFMDGLHDRFRTNFAHLRNA